MIHWLRRLWCKWFGLTRKRRGPRETFPVEATFGGKVRVLCHKVRYPQTGYEEFIFGKDYPVTPLTGWPDYPDGSILLLTSEKRVNQGTEEA